MKTIGIKLADGSFFPVMEDNHPAQKALELTTAHNNQTKVMVDLYRSKSCSMDDAEYVDSLQIDNLVSHPNGEPSIAFSVSLDENSQLSANIKDPETGHESGTAIPLITRSEEELLVPDEYDISNIDDEADLNKQEVKKPLKQGLLSAADKIMENKKKTDLDEPIFGDDALPDFSADSNNIADISHSDMFSTDDFLNLDSGNPETSTDSISDSKDEDSSDTDIPDFTDFSAPDTEETFETELPPESITDFEESEIKDQPNETTKDEPKETAIFDDQALADFDLPEKFETPVDTDTSSDIIPDTDIDFSDLPKDTTSLEEPETDNFDDFEAPVDSDTSSDIIPDTDIDFSDLPKDTTSSEEPETDNFDDFDNFEDNSFTDDSLSDTSFDNLPSVNDSEILPDNNETNEDLEKSLEESKALSDIFSNDDSLPDFDDNELTSAKTTDNNFFDIDDTNDNFNNINAAEETYGLPDDLDNYGSDFDQFPKATSPIDDFSIPDFPEDNSSPELPDNFFDDINDTSDSDNYNYSPTSSGADPLSFTGLYDKETEMGMSGMQSDTISKKTKVPVIVCVICALICLAATAFIFFIKPKGNVSKDSLISVEKQEEITLDKNNETNETKDNQLKIIEEQAKPLPPPIPEAKEDEIIIVEQAEKVIPKQPEVIKEKLNDIYYNVIWGDTLWDIANTYYKNPWKYTDIAKYNGIENPDHIISGTTLVIPAE